MKEKKSDSLCQTGEEMDKKNKLQTQRKNSLKKVEKGLQELIAMDDMKEQFQKIKNVVENLHYRNEKLGIKSTIPCCHTQMIGSQGFAKKNVGKILCELFFSQSLINSNEFILVDAKRIFPHYTFENELRDKDGGLIYIDNIDDVVKDGYQKNNFFHDKINKAIRTYEDRFAFILAGNSGSLEKLFDYCPTLESNIQFRLLFKPYTENDTIKIAREIARNYYGYKINTYTSKKLLKLFHHIEEEERNYYAIESIIKNAVIHHHQTIDFSNTSKNKLEYLNASDFILKTSKSEERKKHIEKEKPAIEELNSLIGLDRVKKQVTDMVNFLKVQSLRSKEGLKHDPICLHLEFRGNPGTGKTTTARIIGKIYKELGLLSEGNFVETDRNGLVAPYIGQTAPKVLNRVNQARGGVLFIDEAYSLNGYSNKDFGHEAISTLIKYMEDDREDLAVIFAGYHEEMEEFINMNPGLKDRISYQLVFDDYTPEDLTAIFTKFAHDQQYTLDTIVRERLLSLFKTVFENKGENFSNGRFVRKIFERVKIIQSKRIINSGLKEPQSLKEISIEDIDQVYEDDLLKPYLNTVEQPAFQIGFRR